MSKIPNDLLDLVKELAILEEERKRKEKERQDFGERLYEELSIILPKEKEKPHKIEISLE